MVSAWRHTLEKTTRCFGVDICLNRNQSGVAMRLSDYLNSKGISRYDFAAKIGRSPEAVRRYMTGDRKPEEETMRLIAQITEGEVTANDFFGIAA
jgi:transcriptional regulator with XRE-family HTH domain